MMRFNLLSKWNEFFLRRIGKMVRRRLASGSIKGDAKRAAAVKLLKTLAAPSEQSIQASLRQPKGTAGGGGA